MIKMIGNLDKEFDAEVGKLKAQVRNSLRKAGEKYVETARNTNLKLGKDYQDHTVVLRNSNTYVIKEGGLIIDEAGETADIFKDHEVTGDISLIAGNPTVYASPVQRLGFDVTDSGQLAAEAEAKRLLKK